MGHANPSTTQHYNKRSKGDGKAKNPPLNIKRRSSIEPVIGHMKHDHRLGRNYLLGIKGDGINAVMSGAGFNLRKLMGGSSEIRANVPAPLAPQDLDLDGARAILLKDAIQALQKLDIATNLVSGQEWLLYGFVRKEAVVTSQIEGTQATLIDLLNNEEDGQQNADLEEVCNYLAALNYAWDELTAATGLPLSLRLIKEAHRRLMRGVRGQNKTPGEFRISQNWIGGMRPSDATFVPPPPQ